MKIRELLPALESAPAEFSSRYEAELDRATSLYGSCGISVPRVGPLGESRFPNLPLAQQAEILKALEYQNRLLKASLVHEPEFRGRNHSLVWGALKELGLRPPSDAFTHIKDSHLVEIYNVNFGQIFRSLNFLQFVSYSIDELMTYHWHELYERTGSTTDEMLRMIDIVKANKAPTTYVRPFTRCVVREKFSPKAIAADSDSVIGASLFNSSGEFAGYLSVVEIFHSWSEPVAES
ncbi:MAG: hypothetical protein EOP05_10795 [Proteobacteria bacterium]|nr:MAG: hypothetical protein EOP05_10795 [Pseudomonadota bacterium]